MNNKNLPPFYVGQKIVAVEDYLELKKGNVYVVKEIYMPCCSWVVHVGVKYDFNKYDGTHICCCGNIYNTNGNAHFYTHRFRPLQEQSFPLITYSKVLEEVPACAN